MALFWHEEPFSAGTYLLEVHLNHAQIRRLRRRSTLFARIFGDPDSLSFDEDGLYPLTIDTSILQPPADIPAGTAPPPDPPLAPSRPPSPIAGPSGVEPPRCDSPTDSQDYSSMPSLSPISGSSVESERFSFDQFPSSFPEDLPHIFVPIASLFIPLTPPFPPPLKRRITLPPTLDDFIRHCEVPLPPPTEEDVRMHLNYHHSPSLPRNFEPERNPEGYPLLVAVDCYHFILALDILSRPDDSYFIPFLPRYFNFLQLVNMGMYIQSSYLNIYIAKWYAEPRDLTFLFTFIVRYAPFPSSTDVMQSGTLDLDPSIQWLYRTFQLMVPTGLPPLQNLIFLVREELRLATDPVLRVLYRGRFHDIFEGGASFDCPIYPQLLFNTLAHINVGFPQYDHDHHFSRSHITCGLCNRDHPSHSVHPSVFGDPSAAELAILPCCFAAVHPSCMLSLMDFMATGHSDYHSGHQSWLNHPFLQRYFSRQQALFPRQLSIAPPLPRHTCIHCHLTMDLNLLLLLGRNLEQAFQPATLSSNGEQVQPPAPIMRRGDRYNLFQPRLSPSPIFRHFYSLLLPIYRRYHPTQIGSERAAPTLHSLTPSQPSTMQEDDFIFPRN